MARPLQVPVETRRTYEAPAVFRIRVVGDELAVAGCKSAVNGPGGGKPNCQMSICKAVSS